MDSNQLDTKEPDPVEQLRRYLRSCSPEQLQEEWDEIEKLGIEGPTLDEVLSFLKK